MVPGNSADKAYLCSGDDRRGRRTRLEDVKLFLSQSGSQSQGEGFFKSLACYLSKTLAMDFVCIDRLVGDGLAARTLAMYDNGAFQDNVEYPLKDPPCGDVVGKAICCFPMNIRGLFPRDEVLKTMKAESYVGTTLWEGRRQADRLDCGHRAQPPGRPRAGEVGAETRVAAGGGRTGALPGRRGDPGQRAAISLLH